ncbi:DNA methyltransferase [Mycoplasma anserisalpingitidis]|uniref:site-specific DNA-methyltransferase (cytosine-N(4)-specific) n=1 Tax=Mycoplasma anserisalpingitidis TaxID=519450 RepID=A0A5B8K0E0_9MOLU|nr:DNA methyltransferase [Mycoplasma anserisalpingitidis]QDY88261.1 site-specific DNA-methyltransferase [Mycoplasma anserisalpingitidis]
MILSNEEKEKINFNSYKRVNSLNSYLAMFPLDLPVYFISKYSEENDLVVDNFSGRGSTLVAARMLKRNFIGNDLNPYAYVCSKFKTIKNITKEDILIQIDNLENEYLAWKNNYKIDFDNFIFKDIKIFFHSETLTELFFIREKLGKSWLNNNDLDNSILCFLLSILHGSERKDGNSIYLSVSMPNTISMSPNYVKNYIKNNKLILTYRNVFELLKLRVNSSWDEVLETSENYLKIFYANSTEELNFIDDESVKMIFTSPPYLKVVNYTDSNWLRLWVLGYEKENLKNEIKLDDKHNFSEYCNFILSYLKNIYPKVKKNGYVFLVIGDVKDFELAKETWSIIKNQVKFELIDIFEQEIEDNKKVLKMVKNKPKATKKDKIIMLRKY